MLPTRKEITAKLIEIALKNYQKVIRNMQEKRIEKHRTRLYAVLISGSIKRIK